MTDLGKILVMPKDEWSASAAPYEILDSVTLDGKAYISKKNNNTAKPSGNTDANWFLFAKDGFSPVASVAKVDKVATISVTKKDGTSESASISDGVSAVLTSVQKVNGVTTVVITDVDGPHQIQIEDGVDGNGIKDFQKVSVGLVDTYTITYDDDTTSSIVVTNGKGIKKIEKTSTVGLVDTYTITFNDNTTQTYTVTNGKGIKSLVKTNTSTDATGHTVHTYTITYNDDTTQTYDVVDGKDGTGTGDMEKVVYDTDDDGIVDGILGNAELVKDTVGWTGKNLIPYPYEDGEYKTITGVTISVDSNGVLTLNGTATSNQHFELNTGLSLSNGKYNPICKFSGGKSHNDETHKVYLRIGHKDNSYWGEYNDYSGKSYCPIVIDNSTENNSVITVKLEFVSGTTFTNYKVYPMLCKADILDDTYEPYHKTIEEELSSVEGTKLISTVSGNTLSFTNAVISSSALISNPYIQDVFVGIEDVTISGTTVTFTLSDDSADGKSAIIYIK